MSITEFNERFSVEGNCSALNVGKRWSDNADCLHCKAIRIWWLEVKIRFEYDRCIKRLIACYGSYSKSSSLPLKASPLAINLMMIAHKGNSVVQFAEEPDVIQKMAVFLERRIHESCASGIPVLSKEIEIGQIYPDGNRNELSQHGAICDSLS